MFFVLLFLKGSYPCFESDPSGNGVVMEKHRKVRIGQLASKLMLILTASGGEFRREGEKEREHRGRLWAESVTRLSVTLVMPLALMSSGAVDQNRFYSNLSTRDLHL